MWGVPARLLRGGRRRCPQRLVGRVTSKREALQWAKETLDVEWSDLIQGALDDRPEPWLRVHRPARPGTVDRTWDFIEYAQAVAARQRDRFKGVLAS
jgi:hypothetical protein